MPLEIGSGAAGHFTRAAVVGMPFSVHGCTGVGAVLRLRNMIRKRIMLLRSG